LIRATVQHVGFDFAASYQAQAQARNADKALTGVESSLGGGWELSAVELSDLLNKARARWVGRSR
jgi:hypothetical protein